MIIYIYLFVLLAILLFFIWSNYMHIKNHIALEKKLELSIVELKEIKKQYNSHIYQLNKDFAKVRYLENLLINRKLKKVKKEKDLDEKKETIKRTFGKITPPLNKDLEEMEEETDYFVGPLYPLIDLPKNIDLERPQEDNHQ